MAKHRSFDIFLFLLQIFAALMFTNMPALAVTTACGLKASTSNGEVDIGSGQHQNGLPQHNSTVTYTLSSFNGFTNTTARVQGTLYLDKIFSGCARVRINFQDINFNNLQATSDTHFCGPGNDANNPQNKRNFDVTSFANTALRRVQIVLGEGSNSSSIEDDHIATSRAPDANSSFTTVIDNGVADFGGNSHSLGSPSSPAFVRLTFSNSNVFGEVAGALYWDSLFGSGTSRMDIDFMKSNNTVLHTDVNQITGQGGNANNDNNKVGVSRLFNAPLLQTIRLRLGQFSNGHFINTVANRTFSFGAGCNN